MKKEDEKMHINFIIGAMSYSGAEKVLSIVSSELCKLGHNVSVILLEQKYGISNKEEYVTTYGAKSTGNKINRILIRWRNIRSIIKKIQPDVIVSFGYVCNVNTIPSLFGIHIPKVLCERNDPVYDPRKNTEKLARFLLYRFATGYVFQTDEIKNYFSSSIRKKSVVIPNPISDSGLRWELDKSFKKIATVARLDDYQKNHIVMFKAFAEFVKNNPEYTLNIYGDGPDKEKYIRIISELKMDKKIILHGKKEKPILELLKAEIFLFTSRYEGMPNALMEAMSIGMPCISTDCGGGGAKTLFSLANTGVLVPVGNVKEITLALENLTRRKSEKIRLGKNALYINKCLNQEKIGLQWENYLSTLVSK